MTSMVLSSILLFAYPLSNNILTNVYAQQGRTTAQTPASSNITPPLQNTHRKIISSISNNTNTLFDVGTATTKVKPDKVTINLGVETTNQTAKAALNTNSATMHKVLNVLISTGVKLNETSTSAFSILQTITIQSLGLVT
jgi:uncharacterized protein YggE